MLSKDEEAKLKSIAEFVKYEIEMKTSPDPVALETIKWLADKALALHDELVKVYTPTADVLAKEILDPNPLSIDGKAVAFLEDRMYFCIFCQHASDTKAHGLEHARQHIVEE